MTTVIDSLFERLKSFTRKEGQTEFVSLVITSLLNKEHCVKENLPNEIKSYNLLKVFLGKIINTIDDLSSEILKDDLILISVKNQKVLRTCFQLITSIGISPCLIPGLGISLSKRCSASAILPQIHLTDDEKYQLLVDCTNFFTRSYKVPVLKNIIITLHLSDYLAALIQLAFAPLKKPGNYSNFIMTQEKYANLCKEREQFVLTYEHLVSNCFQPTLMKELLVLQSLVDPGPPNFVKRVIAKELSRRLLTSGGLMSLIRCFIESYDIDTGLEWKKIDMICRIVTAKHGTLSEEDYLKNIASQLVKILALNNTHYLTTAIACVLSLKDKYPDCDAIKMIVKEIFHAFDLERLISKANNSPGIVILSPIEVDHKVNVLHACVCCTKLDWHVSLLEPNLYILFLIGMKCTKSEDLKLKIRDILIKCLENLNKNELKNFMNKVFFDQQNGVPNIDIIEYESGIVLKSIASTENAMDSTNIVLYFLNLFNSATDNDFVKLVFESALEIFIDINLKRSNKGNKDLLSLEEDIVIDEIDNQYATVLRLLSEISTSPKVIQTLKKHPCIIVNFIKYFLCETNYDEECTSIALVLLNTVLANADRRDDFENQLVTVIPVLKKMSQHESGFTHILCKEALSLLSPEKSQARESPCAKAISDVFDNLLPVRAHGIMELTKLIDGKDAETISKKHYIFCIFQEQLKDTDSYIYLSAINGLATLCTYCPEDVLQVLCREFLQPSEQQMIQTKDAQNKTSELRMKIGDVIVKVIRRLGEMAVVHKTVVLNTMLCGCRDEDPLIRTSALSNLAEIALVLHYKIGHIIYEVLLCIWSIIETDKASECRRAAVMVISSLLKGLGKETLIQLKENLLPLYRTLKALYQDNDEDPILKLHAQIALEELNDIVNQFLFTKVKMEKRIFVLDKPEEVFK